MPREYVADAGLPNSDPFPYGARESARQLGLYGTATILDWTSVDDGGGDIEDAATWTPRPAAVDARLDPIGGGAGGVRGGALNENSSHIITFRDGLNINTGNRVEMEGSTWAITVERERTDELVTRVEVMKV